MANYEKLLYSLGGGIISDMQRDAQNGSATIAIGLGGTGKDALKFLKKQVYQRIIPDNPEYAVPKYEHIRYLCIDTDDDKLKEESDLIGLDADYEFFNISGNLNMFTSPTSVAMLEAKPYAKWLNCDNMKLNSVKGAGGVRQIGRYLLLDKSDQVVIRLQQIMSQAVVGLNSRDVNIHILTGIGGGTGAGTILDFCYILKHAIMNCNALAGKNVKVCGYFFMPDVNFAKDIPNNIHTYIEANSFAVMKELDYCMNFDTNGGKWNQVCNGFTVDSKQSPVDVAYLISAQSVNGTVQRNGYEYAMGVCGDYIVQFISDNSINMDTHLANYARAESGMPKSIGGNYKYVILGGSNAVVPMREIMTYLSGCLFKRMSDSWGKVPTEEEVTAFMDKQGLTVDKLLNDLGSCRLPMPEIENTFDRISTNDSGSQGQFAYVLPAPILKPFIAMRQGKVNQFAAGKQSFMNPWSYGMSVEEMDAKSIVCRVYKALETILKDVNFGPYYAAEMLMGSNIKNVINRIDGMLNEVTAKYNDEYAQMGLTINAVKSARKNYNERPRFDPFGSKKKELFEALILAVKRDQELECECLRLSELQTALAVAKKQLTNLYNDFFRKYAEVLRDLERVFVADIVVISQIVPVTDPFTLPLFDITQVRMELDETVKTLDLGTAINLFTDAFFEKAYDVWSSGNEEKIAKWISGYMSEAFKEYTAKSLDDHIKNKYPEVKDDLSKLTEKVKVDIIQTLDMLACELFSLDAGKAPRVASHQDTITYCAAPATAPIINQAIRDYIGVHAGITQVDGCKNRIFFLKSSCCVPMFAYSLIDTHFNRYQATQETGMHLYEGNAKLGDGRNWRQQLPNLRPYQVYRDIDYTTAEKQGKVIAYGKAEDYKIIHAKLDDNGNETAEFYLWLTPDYTEKIATLKTEVELARKNATVAGVTTESLSVSKGELEQKVEALRSYKEDFIDFKFHYGLDPISRTQKRMKPELEPVELRNDGVTEVKFEVRRDYVLDAPDILSLVELEVSKQEAYDAVVKEALEVIDALKKQCEAAESAKKVAADARPIFVNGLFTGVLQYAKNHTITFEDKDEFGFDNREPITLSRLGAKPFGACAPIYQAYQAFLALSAEEKQVIEAKVTMYMNGEDEYGAEADYSDTMKKACDMLQTTLTRDYMGMVREQTRALPEANEIASLYSQISRDMKHFKMQRGL